MSIEGEPAGRTSRPALVVLVIFCAVVVIAVVTGLLVWGFRAAAPDPYQPSEQELEVTLSSADDQDLNVDLEHVQRVLGHRLDRAQVSFNSIDGLDDRYFVVFDGEPSPAVVEQTASAIEGEVLAEFRAVLAIANDDEVQTTDALSTEDQQRLAELDCTTSPGITTAGDDVLLACAAETDQTYLLGPEQITGAHLAEVTGQDEYVQITFDADGTEALTSLSTDLSQHSEPGNQMAVVVDGEVLTAPAVMEPLTGGSAQLAGFATEQVDLVTAQLELAARGGQISVLDPAEGS